MNKTLSDRAVRLMNKTLSDRAVRLMNKTLSDRAVRLNKTLNKTIRHCQTGLSD